jgi:hydroxymethylpyrimidine/phosphomethylpyrimidine kinase
MHTPTVLTIAGFDPYGGAGIQIDTKTIHALGGYALSATTAVTAQNSQGVAALEAVSPDMLALQLRTLLDDIEVDAVKIGMLANASLIEVVADILKSYKLTNVVLDPVLVSSSGKVLLEPAAVEKMIVKLFPLCRLITPNLDETNTLLGTNFQGSAKDVPLMAEGLFGMGARNILLKGGHTKEKDAVDCLVELSSITRFATPRIQTSHTHGTGCLLSSAIATYLAKGEGLAPSVKKAKNFLYDKLQNASSLKLSYVENKKVTRKEPIF